MAWCSTSEFGWEVNERQVNIRWKPATPDGNLENVTAVVSLDIHQDVVLVKKPRIEVYCMVFVPVAIAQILPTRIQTRTISQMMMAYYSNLMAMTLNLMAYLKNNDGNALMHLGIICAVQQISIWLWSRS